MSVNASVSQMAGLPNPAPADVDDVNKLVKLAEDVLDHKSMEFLPFGGRMPLSVSNRERLDWFADQLVKERRARLLHSHQTVEINKLSCSLTKLVCATLWFIWRSP